MRTWAKIKIVKRKLRHTFGRNRVRNDGREEFIVKIPGFSGELRRTMTEEEAEKWVIESNKDAFMSASKASEGGIHGVERFNQFGVGDKGFSSIIMRAAARSFADRKDPKDERSKEE